MDQQTEQGIRTSNKWRNLHNDGASPKEIDKSHSFSREIKKSLGPKVAGLSRTESDPSPVKTVSVKSDVRNSVRRRFLLNASSDNSVGSCSKATGRMERDEFPIVSGSLLTNTSQRLLMCSAGVAGGWRRRRSGGLVFGPSGPLFQTIGLRG